MMHCAGPAYYHRSDLSTTKMPLLSRASNQLVEGGTDTGLYRGLQTWNLGGLTRSIHTSDGKRARDCTPLLQDQLEESKRRPDATRMPETGRRIILSQSPKHPESGACPLPVPVCHCSCRASFGDTRPCLRSRLGSTSGSNKCPGHVHVS